MAEIAVRPSLQASSASKGRRGVRKAKKPEGTRSGGSGGEPLAGRRSASAAPVRGFIGEGSLEAAPPEGQGEVAPADSKRRSRAAGRGSPGSSPASSRAWRRSSG